MGGYINKYVNEDFLTIKYEHEYFAYEENGIIKDIIVDSGEELPHIGKVVFINGDLLEYEILINL